MAQTDSNALAVRDEQRELTTADPEAAASALAHILATGDLLKLTNEQRVAFYLEQCRSLGLNSLSRPFDWLMLPDENGGKKLVLYPNKSCSEQLRRLHQISVRVIRRDVVGEMFVCEVEGRRPNGVTDQASKYVPLVGHRKDGSTWRLSGEKLANAFAKAETGAKRRLALSMVGLSSPPDVDDMSGARFVTVDAHGNVLDKPTPEQRALAADPGLAHAIHEPTFETTAPSSEITATADQGVQTAELERPRRQPGPRPDLKASAFAYDETQRAHAEEQYAELAYECIEAGHPDAADLMTLAVVDMKDGQLQNAIMRLRAWLADYEVPAAEDGAE